MKVAIFGSRNLSVEKIEVFLPKEVSEIVSGGAKGIDTCAVEYAKKQGLLYKEFFPKYSRFGRAAPLKRNEDIAEYADFGIAFWDGVSKGTAHTVSLFRKKKKEIKVFVFKNGKYEEKDGL